MNHIIRYALNDFKRVFKESFVYNPDDEGKYGTSTIGGIVYKMVVYSLIRMIEVDRIKEQYAGMPIIVIGKKIYGPSRKELQQNNIFYLEHRGHLFYPHSKTDKTRLKENHYDKQLNKSRIKGDYGSRIRAAFLLDNNMLNLPVPEIALKLKMGISTIYYFIHQLKLARMIQMDIETGEWKIDLRRFNKNEIIERVFVKGFGKLGMVSGCPNLRKAIERYQHDQVSKVKLHFYDEIKDCEDGCSPEDKLLDSGRIIFKLPFNEKLCPDLNKLFKVEFIAWFLNADLDQLCA